ncbi:hypothetical protein [Paenibacillus sp. FSL M7-0420]
MLIGKAVRILLMNGRMTSPRTHGERRQQDCLQSVAELRVGGR